MMDSSSVIQAQPYIVLIISTLFIVGWLYVSAPIPKEDGSGGTTTRLRLILGRLFKRGDRARATPRKEQSTVGADDSTDRDKG